MKCMFATIGEAVALIALSCGVGLAWNHFSEDGLDLSRDYFKKVIIERPAPTPDGPTEVASAPPSTGPSGAASSGATDNGSDGIAEGEAPPVTTEPDSGEGESYGVDANGLNTVDTGLAADYHSMGEFAVFVDARSRDHYEEGHISGAHYLNHYQSQKLIDGVRPFLEQADFIVVYCGGGDCEDSILLATSLISEYGFDFEKVHVYLGGMEEWKRDGHPITVGAEP